MAPPRQHPHVILLVPEGAAAGPIGEPGERAFRASVALFNDFYEAAVLIADAFTLAITGGYVVDALRGVLPPGWTWPFADVLKGLLENLKWVVAGAGIGATFGAGLGMLLPPAEPLTLAGGAALGAAIASWAFLGVGLWTMGRVMVEVSGVAADLFGKGVQSALAGNKELGARYFGAALALVLGAMVPLAIIVGLTKGAGKVLQAQTTRYMISALVQRVAATEIVTTAQARAVGLLDVEVRAIAERSKGLFEIFRGCNPNRVAAIEREGGLGNVHFKPGYLKDFKSAKAGTRAGEYMIEKLEFENYIRGLYEMVPMGPGRWRLRALGGVRGKNGAVANGTKAGTPYLDNTSPVKDGPWLDGHIVEYSANGGKLNYLIRHPDGKTFVPDIDRLAYMTIGQTGRLGKSGVLKGQKWLPNDDPREVSYFNQLMSSAISRIMGKPVDWRGYQHGKSADYSTPHPLTGEVGPGWPSRNDAGTYLIDNEALVLVINGRLFATDWNGAATFCKALELLNYKFPWAKAIIKGEVQLP